MPALIILGVVAAYGGIGLYVRAKRFPRAPVKDALIWPIIFGMSSK